MQTLSDQHVLERSPRSDDSMLANRGSSVAADADVATLSVGQTAMEHRRLDRDTLPALSLAGVSPLTRSQARIKRGFDVVVTVLLILLSSPLMLAIAAAIKFDSKGPVLFTQEREGVDGRRFRCLKFRSMYHDKSDPRCLLQVSLNDSRVTATGRWLRRLSLDELPQLFNVLVGDMSLVGPRPHAPETRAGDLLFVDAVPSYALRHCVRPGITGWAQVNGHRGQTLTVGSIERRVEFDFYYIRHWSLGFDIRILIQTVTREIFGGNAF